MYYLSVAHYPGNLGAEVGHTVRAEITAETPLRGYKLSSGGFHKGLLIARQKRLWAIKGVVILLLMLATCLAHVVSPVRRHP
jgi:hypothetical protein